MVFENTKNTILVLSDSFCSPNLVFIVFSVFYEKKLGTKCGLPAFFILLIFKNRNQFSKITTKQTLGLLYLIFIIENTLK